MSLVSDFFCVTLCVSMSGLAPETVIVSSIAPTFISALTGAVKSPVRMMPSRLTVLKPAQRERHRVGARRQVDNLVLPVAVTDDCPGLFNQGGAGGFHRDAWHDAAARVANDARNGLRKCGGLPHRQTGKGKRAESCDLPHRSPPRKYRFEGVRAVQQDEKGPLASNPSQSSHRSNFSDLLLSDTRYRIAAGDKC